MKYIKYSFPVIVVLFYISCGKNALEKGAGTGNDQNKIELTPEEVASIAFDEPKELTTAEVIDLVKKHPLIESPLLKGSSSAVSYTIGEKYYIKNDGRGTDAVVPKVKGAIATDSLPVYTVTITSGTKEGSAVVGGDSRISAVLALIPGVKVASPRLEEDPMYQYSKSILLYNLKYMAHLRDSLKIPTLKKLEARLGYLPAVNVYETLKGQIKIREVLTKSAPISTITEPIVAKVGPLTKTEWEQEGVFNQKLSTITCNGTAILPPAGCLPIATVQLLGFYKPAMTVPGANGAPLTINWNYLQETPTIDIWNWPPPAADKIDMAGYLVSHVFTGLKATPKCTDNGPESSAYTSDAENYLRNYINIDGARAFDVNTVKASLDQLRLVLATGNRTTSTGGKSGHAWVVDGYAVTRKPGAVNVFNTYFHCNIGWFWGTGTGWYLVENPLAFSPTTGYDYTINLMCSPNARKK